LINIINEEIIEFNINEALDKVIKTDYEKILNTYTSRELKCDVYRFLTKNKFTYDVDFYHDTLSFKYLKPIPDNKKYKLDLNIGDIDGIIIMFYPTNKITFINVDEQNELIGKLRYLVKSFITKYSKEFNRFIIFKNDNNKLIYNNILEDIFKSYNKFETDEFFYYVKKQLINNNN